jgi:crotonobetainyl-CoA:carnitine CoA-transferase CaiB-like acyl-CoA transferase
LKNGIIPHPHGNRYPAASPIGDFMCKDGKPIMLNISTNQQWKAFAEVLEQPQWLDDPEFASMTSRARNYKKVEAEVSRVFAERDSAEVTELLQSRQCVYGRINNFEDVKNHPQVAFRKTIVNAIYPNGVTFQVPGNPVQMSGMERQIDYESVPLGYNTFEVLAEVADVEVLHEIFDPVIAQVEAASQEMFKKS